jgi:hypothetical protein
MKRTVICLIFILSAWINNAQEIKVKEDKENIGGAKNPVLTVIIYEASESDVEKAWKSLMKDYDAKVSTKDGVFADNAKITEISANTVDVYALTAKTDDGIKLTVAIDLGGVFLSSSTHSAEYKAAEKIIKNFAITVSKKAVEEKLDDASDAQKKLESDLKDLEKKNTRLHNDIEGYKNKITEAEKDIEDNVKDQETTTKSIEAQKKVVEEIQKKLDGIK